MKTIEEIRSKNDLVEYLARGKKAKYLCFWGHTQQKYQSVTKVCFSQWYSSPFEIDGVVYATAEHYMMAEKARLFDCHDIADQIVNASHPQKAKRLGRNVSNFTNEKWNQHRFDIVVNGNLAKFAQNSELKDYLLGTINRVLVEASPVDNIWGVGLAEDNVDVINPFKWKGLNLLGFALMEVREKLRN